MSKWDAIRSMRPTEMRNVGKMNGPNDGTRSLVESIMSREVIAALDDWRQAELGGLLIGTLALNYYAKPRYDDEIAMLVPNAFYAKPNGFQSAGRFRLRHRETQTRLWLLTAKALKLTTAASEAIHGGACHSDGVKIASASGLIAILLGDSRTQASADILTLLRLGGQIDMAGYDLAEDRLVRLAHLQADETRRTL